MGWGKVNTINKVFLLMVAFTSMTGRAETFDAILEQLNRPTMEQLIPLFQKMEGNPFPNNPGRNIRESDTLPRAIAAMERTFPGATWYELGRDSVLLGDIFDGFYLSIGQKGRVKRLDASHPSFNDDYTLTYDFLKTNGIDVTKLENGPSHIVFDTTSFSKTSGVGGRASQSVRTMRAVYQAYAKLGKDPKDLIDKVNFLAIGGGGYDKDIRDKNFDIHAFKKQQRASVKKEEFHLPFFTSLSEFTYSSMWHPMFGKFVRKEDGTITTSPDNQSWMHEDKPEERKQVISEMYEAWKMVSQPAFLKEVQTYARIYGFEYPEKRVASLTPVSSAVSEAAEKSLIHLAREKEERIREREHRARQEAKKALQIKLGLSDFGVECLSRFEDRPFGSPVEAAKLVLEDIPVTDRLTDQDLFGITQILLENAGWNSNEMVKAIAETAQESPRYKKLLQTIKPDEMGKIRSEYKELQKKLKAKPRKLAPKKVNSKATAEKKGKKQCNTALDQVVELAD